MSGKMIKVTKQVIVDHPQVRGAGLVVAVPGDEVPYEKAVEWGLVEGEEPDPEPDPEPSVSTAEVRRDKPPGKKAASSKSDE